MSPFIRFLRFNLVGGIGVAVQLATLALLNRAIPRHYLITSTLAVELTLLHNFAWHLRFTWPAATRRTCDALKQLLRFHLSNGLISLLGNLSLMRLFVRSAHLPILFANTLTIACCGLANFFLAHLWVFSSARPSRRSTEAFIASFVVVLLFAITASAQLTHLPSAPTPPSHDYGVDCAYANIFLGPSAALAASHRVAGTAGITFGQYAARPSHFAASPQFELGIAGPIAAHPIDGLVSANYMFATKIRHRDLYPSFTAGYTRFFVSGNAINFGVSFDLVRQKNNLIRLELRDYFLISQPQENIFSLRFGLGKLIPD
jgi:putative flippase GtrA